MKALVRLRPGHFMAGALLPLATATVTTAAPLTIGFTAIEARYDNGQNRTRSMPDASDPAQRAIDGNLSTETYLTNSFTSGPVYVYLDLSSSAFVSGLRIHKFSNEYGNHDIIVDYTTGSGAVSTRSYSNVTGLQAGFEGTELPIFGAGGGIAGNSILEEAGAAVAPYTYSVTFAGIANATAIRLTIDDDSINTHMRVSEIQAIIPEPSSAVMAFGAVAFLSRHRRRSRE